jgi:DNA-directed RNA polymerase specialized sigma24 family protein
MSSTPTDPGGERRPRFPGERDDSEIQDLDPAEVARARDAMARLSRRQISILLAVRIEGRSYAYVAEQTGTNVAWVEHQLAQAFRNYLRNLEDPNRCRWRRWLKRSR